MKAGRLFQEVLDVHVEPRRVEAALHLSARCSGSIHEVDVAGVDHGTRRVGEHADQRPNRLTGVRAQDTKNYRDWIMTTIWAFSMDAVALGSILMVFGSLYMWWIQPQKRRRGLVAAGLGVAGCGYFVFALRWLF